MKGAGWLLCLGLVACDGAAPGARSPSTTPAPLASAELPVTENSSTTTALPDSLEQRARAFIELLRSKNFSEAVAGFDATMRAALPAEALEATWAEVIASVGALEAIESTQSGESGGYTSVLVTCTFARSRLDAKVVYDRRGMVAGLFFLPSAEPYRDPPYVDRTRFAEREVTVGSGEWALPGTLTLPEGRGPFPAVVIVHGSGPGDRDGTVAAAKPYKDVAGGLASDGVVVLRYDKRTRVHANKLGDLTGFTVDQETVDDALAAVALLEREALVDSKKIVVAGHSLGGFLAPRIAARSASIRAIVILAGSTRPLADSMVDQLKYLAALDARTDPQEEARIREVELAGARIRAIQGGAPPKPGEILIGAGADYWLDLGRYDAIQAAKSFPRPIFVAQGGRDYQVTNVDFEAWRKALAGRKDVVTKVYPELNHLFMAGEGKSRPEEYQHPASVDVRLIEDVARFVKNL